MGREAQAHGTDPRAARGSVRGNGPRSQGGSHRGRVLAQEDSTSRQPQRRPQPLGMPAVLH